MTTAEEFFKKLEAIERTQKTRILQKIASFCYKEYNTWSFWDNWLFKHFLWSEWKIVSEKRIYLLGNAKVLLDSQTISHIKVMCHYRDSDDLPVVKVKSRIFDLRTGQIKEIYKYIGFSYHESLYSDIENPDKQNEIDFICDKTDEIVETISNFIKTITC